MTTKTKAVAKKDEGGALAPSFMQDYMGKGAEDVGSDAIEIPRLKLLQKISPEIDEYDDLKAGEFFHNVAAESLGEEIEIVPCYVTRSYMLWRPRPEGGMLARSVDGKTWDVPDLEFEVKVNKGTKTVKWVLGADVASSYAEANGVKVGPLTAWGTSDPENPQSVPATTGMINVVTALPQHPNHSPCVLTFQNSSFKVGKRFVGNLRISPLPSFGRKFILSSRKVDGQSGPYLEPRVKADGFVEDKAAFDQYKEFYALFKARGVKVGDDVEGEGTEPPAEAEDY